MSDSSFVPEVLISGLVFGEGPRWHDDRLWFSDMHGEAVWTVDMFGKRDLVVELPGRRPSGLGFLPDGDLLIVCMLEREILRWNESGITLHADLSHVVTDACNDMVVSSEGRAYVGSFPPASAPAGSLIMVDPDGRPQVAAEEMIIPNGSVITPDGRTLIVAESLGRRLTAFTIQPDGSLVDRRVYADCPGRGPDGICMDEEGAIWASMVLARAFQRILPGGEVTDSISIEGRMAIACALGGPDRRTLFLLSAWEHAAEALAGTHEGRIDVVQVPVAGAGIP